MPSRLPGALCGGNQCCSAAQGPLGPSLTFSRKWGEEWGRSAWLKSQCQFGPQAPPPRGAEQSPREALVCSEASPSPHPCSPGCPRAAPCTRTLDCSCGPAGQMPPPPCLLVRGAPPWTLEPRLSVYGAPTQRPDWASALARSTAQPLAQMLF